MPYHKYKDQSQQLIDLMSGNKTIIKKQELSSNLEKPKKIKKTDDEI